MTLIDLWKPGFLLVIPVVGRAILRVDVRVRIISIAPSLTVQFLQPKLLMEFPIPVRVSAHLDINRNQSRS